MKPIGEIRLKNLETLIRQFPTMEALAEAAGTSSVYLSQIRNKARDAKTGRPREMGTPMARRLEEAANKPAGWMDTEHQSESEDDGIRLSVADPEPSPAPQRAQEPPPAYGPPASPGPRFEDRHDGISDSDWGLLQDMKLAMESPMLARQIEAIRAEAAATRKVIEQRLTEVRELERQQVGGLADLVGTAKRKAEKKLGAK